MNNNSQNKKITMKMQKKLVTLFILVLLAFVGLIARLIYITRENQTAYEKQILSQQKYDSTSIPAKRGSISDTKGTVLAMSEKVYNLVVDSKVVLSDKDYLEPTMNALFLCFPELDISEVRDYVSTHASSHYYVPLRHLSFEQKTAFCDMQAQDSMIKGIWFEEEYIRKYPYSELACDVLGFTTTDGNGLFGLEEYYNGELSGTDGREYGYVNDDSNFERTVIAATDGYNIQSTIDATIQGICEKYLKDFNDRYTDNYHAGNGAENIGCIIMEVDTANILAMASYPDFDLNNVRDTSRLLGSNLIVSKTNAAGYKINQISDDIIDEDILNSLTDEELMTNLNGLWKNFCISSTYEPGSTAKPFTVAAALDSGTISPNATYECNGYLEVSDYKIKCHNRWGDGVIDIKEAIARSCNVALMKIGQSMGKETFTHYQENFNFGLKTNVDLAGEARTDSLIYTEDKMGPTDLATNTFGQNFNVTMIQMVTGFCSLINGGNYYEPHIVKKITNSAGATVKNIEPRLLKQTISESTSKYIREYCRAVVMPEGGEYRTGKTARPYGYAIGGKTGTAQTIDPMTNHRSDDEYVVSFIGYAPADDPQIAIYVVVDRPNAKAQDDAKFATEIVKNILTEVLPYLNIYMTEELTEAEKTELIEKGFAVTYGLYPDDEEAEEAVNEVEKKTDNSVKPQIVEAVWKGFPIDPVIGYRVDPETGDYYDAETGVSITGANASFGDDVPINEELIEPEN